MRCPYASLGFCAVNSGTPSTIASWPTFSVATELDRHRVPPVFVERSSTASVAVTVASTWGSVNPIRPPLGFTSDSFRRPRNTTGTPRAPLSACVESAWENSCTSMPLCAASRYSSNRRVANSLSVPLAFSIEKVTRPTLPYGSRLRRGATSTVCEVCPPPHPMAATRVRIVALAFTRDSLREGKGAKVISNRSEEHTSELQSQSNLVCRLLLEKKKKHKKRVRQRI